MRSITVHATLPDNAPRSVVAAFERAEFAVAELLELLAESCKFCGTVVSVGESSCVQCARNGEP